MYTFCTKNPEDLSPAVGENVIAAGGYKGEEQIYAKGHCREASLMEAAVRARHETVKSCLKKFKVLSTVFRHDLFLHP